MKLLGITKTKITGEKNGKNVPHLEVVEVVLVHCNIVDDSYQQNSRILYTFVLNKPFGSLLEMFQSEFQEIKVWFTDQNFNPLEADDKINIPLIIK